MQSSGDFVWIVLGLAILVLFGWYFWHAGRSFFVAGRLIVDYLDSRSMRLRQRLEHEAIHGKAPLWYRLVQKLIVFMIIAGAAALVWNKFKSA